MPVLSAGSDEVIGESGSGSFTQFGGTNAITGDLSVGTGAGRGIYNLSAGSLTVSGNESIGSPAPGPRRPPCSNSSPRPRHRCRHQPYRFSAREGESNG